MEQDAESLLWSSYRTIGEGWPDFYALLREPMESDAESLRLSINATYAHAGANRDHRDLRRRFYYQMLQEKVLPEARRILLDPASRLAYDGQWKLHLEGAPDAASYEHFLAALPKPRASGPQLDAQIAQELTERLESQLASQRSGPASGAHSETTADEMGTWPVSAPPDAALDALPDIAPDTTSQPQAPQVLEPGHSNPPTVGAEEGAESDAASGAEEGAEEGAEAGAEPVMNSVMDSVIESDESEAALHALELEPGVPGSMRVRGGGRLLAGGLVASAVPASREARVVVGLSNDEIRPLGRRSQRRWARRSALRLGAGALAVALLGAGTTWALLGRGQGTRDDIQLQASVENAIARAVARSGQGAPSSQDQDQVGDNTQPPQPPQPGSASAASTTATVGAARTATGTATITGVAASVPRMRLDTLLRNADFEGLPGCSDGDLKPWTVWAGGRRSGLGAAFAVGAGREQDTRSGRWRLVFWKGTPYEASVSQVVRNLRPGVYQLNAWVKSSGGQQWAGAVVADYGGPRIHLLAPTSSRWTPITVRGIRVTSGQCKIGFYTRSAVGRKWLAVDAVEFHPQG